MDPTRLILGDVCLGMNAVNESPVYLSPRERTHHLYIIGKSGSGKSTLLHNLIEQDMLAGHGLAVLAPDDEMFRDYLLRMVPEHRRDDVIYVDPADTDRPVPLNPLHLADGERLHEKVDEMLGAFLRLVEGGDTSGAPRLQRILRHTLLTLIEIPNQTLADIPRLLRRDVEGQRFRQWAIPRITDEDTRLFWQTDYNDFPKDAHQSVLNRLAGLLTPPTKRLLCTPGACLNFREAMDTGKIVLFRLTAKALEGAGNAGIVGQLVVAKLRLAALSREDVPEDQRRFFSIYIDEFQNFCSASVDDYREMFARLRKYRAPLTIAHLGTTDLSESLMRHILGTVSTYVVFQTSHADAKRLAHELVERTDGELAPVHATRLVALPPHQAFAKVRGGVQHLRMTAPPRRNGPELANDVVRRSRAKYGYVADGSRSPIAESALPPTPIEHVDPADPFS